MDKLLSIGLAAMVAAAFFVLAGIGSADLGVGITTGEMTVRTTLTPGRGYILPSIGVINTGDESGQYVVTIGFLEGQDAQRPGIHWFSFDRDRFELGAGESADVTPRIVVPSDASPGKYFALIRAQTVSETGETGGEAGLGVAAATKVTFSVQSAGWLTTTSNTVNRWLDDNQPWTYLAPAVLLLGFLASRAGRLPFRLRVERK